MNVQRYKWPVIIAAGLHGALFLCGGSSDGGISKRPPKPKPDPWTCGITAIEINEPESSPGDTVSSGGGAALPEIPDRPAVLPDHTVFTVPVNESSVPFDRHRLLPEHTGLPPGDGAGWTGSKVPALVDATSLDSAPRARMQPPPDYPARMRQEGVGGSVVVEFVVNTAGLVVRAEAVSCTHRDFVEPALRAVRSWRFEPGRRNNRVVPFRMTVPIEFWIDRS